MRVTVLGCGTSTGVPVVGCDCAVCRSTDPKNHRLRCSALVETQGKRLLIDTGPDLRQQALRHGITTVDAVLFTHAHADHLHGLDEVRSFNITKGGAIDAFADRATLWQLETRFGYCLHGHGHKPGHGWWRPALVPHLIDGPFDAAGIAVTPFTQGHGGSTTTGFRIGNFAYSPDADTLPDPTLEALQGLDLWIVDALRDRPHPSHSHLQRTLQWIAQVRPKHAVLTHMNHEVDYTTWRELLPAGVEPGYDGMVLDLDD
ncbi:MAG: MBL fold metallo-hydrolase [Geminicoccaceae bacterium]|nr:MAG: MBL fold metallo-hydrolase [Geminicoccaceae bacterium]